MAKLGHVIHAPNDISPGVRILSGQFEQLSADNRHSLFRSSQMAAASGFQGIEGSWHPLCNTLLESLKHPFNGEPP
jgi:hypothetical protein